MGGSAIVRPRADWVRILEAIYAPVADDAAWAKGVLERMQGGFHCTDGIGLTVVEHDPEGANITSLVNVAFGIVAAIAEQNYDFTPLGPDAIRGFFYPPAIVTTHSELDLWIGREGSELMSHEHARYGFADSVGIIVNPDPGIALVLYSTLPRRCSPTKHERRLLSRVGLHLESAWRLRRRPEILKAVITLDASRVERTTEAPPAAKLMAHARKIESSLTRSDRGDYEQALDLWTALAAGRYSFVPRTENGRRRYLVLENEPRSQPMRALSAREIDVLSMAARGMSTKLVAYALGLSSATVSSALLRAASKLGLASRIELLRLAATISGDPRARALPAKLTAAESAILELLRQGMSNQEIAGLRSRSVRTIANQVASLLRKTASGSRRAFVAR